MNDSQKLFYKFDCHRFASKSQEGVQPNPGRTCK